MLSSTNNYQLRPYFLKNTTHSFFLSKPNMKTPRQGCHCGIVSLSLAAHHFVKRSRPGCATSNVFIGLDCHYKTSAPETNLLKVLGILVLSLEQSVQCGQIVAGFSLWHTDGDHLFHCVPLSSQRGKSRILVPFMGTDFTMRAHQHNCTSS